MIERLTRLEGRHERLEQRFDLYVTKDYLQQVVQPIERSVQQIEYAIKSQSESTNELYEAHKKMMEKDEQRKQKEFDERTFFGLAKKWLPLAAGVVALVTLFRVIGTWLEIYLQTKGIK